MTVLAVDPSSTPNRERLAEFFVAGTPQQKGSTKSFTHPRTRKIITLSANDKLKFWESNVRAVAHGVWEGAPSDRPVHVNVVFFFDRPCSHCGTGRNAGILKTGAPKEHVKNPDLDKLVRGLLDGLTEVVFKDDRQVISITARKRYLLFPRAGHGPGALVTVREA